MPWEKIEEVNSNPDGAEFFWDNIDGEVPARNSDSLIANHALVDYEFLPPTLGGSYALRATICSPLSRKRKYASNRRRVTKRIGMK